MMSNIFHLLYNDVNYDSYCGFYVVGGFSPSEKYEFVSRDDELPNIWKIIIHSCSVSHQPGKKVSLL